MERNQAEEMGRAADKLAEAVSHLDLTLSRFLEVQESGRMSGGTILRYVGVGGYGDEPAVKLAIGLKHAGRGAREPGLVVTEDEDPDPEGVRSRREERRASERAHES